MAKIPFHPKALRYRQREIELVEAYETGSGYWMVKFSNGFVTVLSDQEFKDKYELDDTGLDSHMNAVHDRIERET